MMPRISYCPRWLVVLVMAAAWCLLGVAGAAAQPASPEAPQTPEYVIGARDVLQVAVWGQADRSKDYPVDQDGFVPCPLVGRVRAAGLTTKQFAARLAELLEKDYLVNPQVMVSVKEYLSKKVQVLGEAEKPGL